MDKVYEVNRVSDRLIVVKLVINEMIVSVVSVYAPQVGLCESLKDSFYDELQTTVAKFSPSETWFICGDYNGHIGKYVNSFEDVHGGSGYGERILEFAMANDLVVGNSQFVKRDSHLITY